LKTNNKKDIAKITINSEAIKGKSGYGEYLSVNGRF
jgi:hypothetical protein